VTNLIVFPTFCARGTLPSQIIRLICFRLGWSEEKKKKIWLVSLEQMAAFVTQQWKTDSVQHFTNESTGEATARSRSYISEYAHLFVPVLLSRKGAVPTLLCR